MADYAVPKNGVAYIFYGCLVSQADTKLFKSVPTLAAGDFKVSIDGGAFANLATLPTNTPGTFSMKFSLSAAEMTGDNILVVASDVAGAEWCDQCWNIQTSARGIADLAFPATTGRSMVVDANGLVDSNMVKAGPTGAGAAVPAGGIPNAVAGAAGGLQIAGANAATTYATLTSTGAFSINGVSMVAQTGDNFPRIGAPVGASISVDIAAIQAKTVNLPAAPASTTNITSASGIVVLTNGDKTGYTTIDFTTAVAESYRANGATGTPAQMLYEILGNLVEANNAGTTRTVKGLDHATTKATYTYDNATPNTITRAT